MTHKRKTVGLITFLKGDTNTKAGIPGCSNYDHLHGGGCLTWGECLVEKEKRCKYFERAVLPAAKDIGLAEHILSLYEKHVGITGEGLIDLGEDNVRRCPGINGKSCGIPLRGREKYCPDCKTKRRRQTYRRSRESKTT